MLECVINISEGRDALVVDAIAAAAGRDLLDVHTDPDHHRSVLTLVGEEGARRVASEAIARLDLSTHRGVHPRLGVVDIVPFVPLDGSTITKAVEARDAFAAWLTDKHAVPVFLYGPERSLPEVRREAFRARGPDLGPPSPHPTAGACCVGARPVLVAYNVWVDGIDVDGARAIAAAIRRPGLQALGLAVGDHVQVSMNLIDPAHLRPDHAYDLVESHLTGTGGAITTAELVGLIPSAVLGAVEPDRRAALDLSDDRTIEDRMAARA